MQPAIHSCCRGEEARAVIERLDAMSPSARLCFRAGMGHLQLS